MDAVIPVSPTTTHGWDGLHRFLDAWASGLRLAVPARWRQRWFPPPMEAWLRLDDGEHAWVARRDVGGLEAADRHIDAAAVLARHPDLPRWLLLPPQLVARVPVTLPLAAAGQLRQALQFEVDRQTPFTLADVAFDARALQADSVAKTVLAELIVVPRAKLAPLLARAQALGIRLQGVDVADVDGRPAGVNLLPDEARWTPVNRWRRRNLWLALSVLALLVLGAVVSVQRQNARATDLEARLQRDRVQARLVAAQRQQLVDYSEAAQQIQALRDRRPSLVVVQNALAERLAGNAWVERISIQGDQLQLSGQSPQATRLVPALQGSTLWRDVTMSGAVAAEGGNGGERYALGLRLTPMPAKGVAR